MTSPTCRRRQQIPIPLSPDHWADLSCLVPLTPDEWDRLLAVLAAMRPAVVAQSADVEAGPNAAGEG